MPAVLGRPGLRCDPIVMLACEAGLVSHVISASQTPDTAHVAPTRENICAVVVTFHPDPHLPERLERIAPQVQRILIVDNHSDAATIALLRMLSPHLGVKLILNPDNVGIATALNQGMAYAESEGFVWALLLDQDTIPFESMVHVLTQAYSDYPDKERVALIGANFEDASTQQPSLTPGGAGAASWVEQKTAITSGSLVSVPVYSTVGRFKDELFIDDVDFEYCLRARARGFKVIVAREPVMTHAIGAPAVRRFLWRTVRPSNHSAVRWYYMTRNPILLAQEYWRTDSAWVVANLYGHLKWMIKMVLYEADKLAKIQLMLRGAWHGLRGRTGRLEGNGFSSVTRILTALGALPYWSGLV
jgi:rhamnosyltransferase